MKIAELIEQAKKANPLGTMMIFNKEAEGCGYFTVTEIEVLPDGNLDVNCKPASITEITKPIDGE